VLRNTLILPPDDATAAKLLSEAISDLNVILMLVLGVNGTDQVVGWADQLCEKTKLSDGTNARHVVWVQNPDLPSVRTILSPILGSTIPIVAVLNFYDKLMATLDDISEIDPIALELAFVDGGKNA
jgi:hypothetical protein